MSTIELVDPELRDALALWPQVPLTAETLTRRRADALALLSSVPTPDLPDIATGEIHVESAFGAKPIRVLTYRPVRSDDPLPVIVHIHGGGFVMGTPEMKDVENRLFASELKCAIYSVDYRLAPEADLTGTEPVLVGVVVDPSDDLAAYNHARGWTRGFGARPEPPFRLFVPAGHQQISIAVTRWADGHEPVGEGPVFGGVSEIVGHGTARDCTMPAKFGSRPPSASDVSAGSLEHGGPRVDRTPYIGVIHSAGKEMQVEVRQRVAVNLVVHLDRMHELGDGLRHQHRVMPEARLLLRRHVERLNNVVLRDDAYVAG